MGISGDKPADDKRSYSPMGGGRALKGAERLYQNITATATSAFTQLREEGTRHLSSLTGRITPTVNALANFFGLYIDPLLEKNIQEWIDAAPPEERPSREEAAERIKKCRTFGQQKLLDLSNLGLTSLPSAMGKVWIESLNLSHNNLSSLPKEMESLQLDHINLSHNNFTDFPKAIFASRRLQKLDISFNTLESLPPGIGALSFLRTLKINHNSLSSLPMEISYLPFLESLDFSENSLSELPEALEAYLNNKPDPLWIQSHGNPLPEEVLNALKERGFGWFSGLLNPPRELPPPEPDFLSRGHPESLLPRVSLNTAINFWKGHLPSDQSWPSDFTALENHDFAPSLIRFLQRLKEGQDYTQASEGGKIHYAERVKRILVTMNSDESFRDKAMPLTDEALTECGDRITLALNKIEILWYVHTGVPAKNLPNLAALAVALKRIQLIHEKTESLNPDISERVEVELFLQIHLAKKLKLPIDTKSQLYPNLSVIQEADIPEIETEIRNATTSKEAIISALVEQDFWRDRLRNEENPAGYHPNFSTVMENVIIDSQTLPSDIQERMQDRMNTDPFNTIVEIVMEASQALPPAIQQERMNAALDYLYRDATGLWYEAHKNELNDLIYTQTP